MSNLLLQFFFLLFDLSRNPIQNLFVCHFNPRVSDEEKSVNVYLWKFIREFIK